MVPTIMRSRYLINRISIDVPYAFFTSMHAALKRHQLLAAERLSSRNIVPENSTDSMTHRCSGDGSKTIAKHRFEESCRLDNAANR